MKELFEWIINLIFPIKCLGCNITDTMFCDKCLNQVPNPHHIEDKNIIAVASYKDKNIKRALWLLKFHNRKIIASSFGRKMADVLMEELVDRAMFENFVNPVLVPIPLSKKRLHERGYNQAELLAIAIAKSSASTFTIDSKALIKIRDTGRQAMIRERNKRLQNLSGCFRARTDRVRGKNIILVDDITTTGGTLTEARRALKKAGARKVLAITVAH